ncbi:WXG100-like domain-containing protein, partial [Streptomyces mirabilis]|uniref:WXG100-like domain-containing protein n=1 Tax=Streptomyces mirabilis TaxID=68239 RepID=UPI00368E3045
MGLQLPEWARDVAHYTVGVWPAADEDRLVELAGVYEQLAVDVRGLIDGLVSQSGRVEGWQGQARDAHDARLRQLLEDSGLEDVVSSALETARAVRETAAAVVKAKYQAIEILGWLVASIAWAVAWSPATGGASLGWIAGFEAAAYEALGQVGVWLARLVAAAGTGALFMVGANGLAQGIAIGKGYADSFNWGELGMSAGVGALAGAIGLGVGAAAGAAEGAVRRALGQAARAVEGAEGKALVGG